MRTPKLLKVMRWSAKDRFNLTSSFVHPSKLVLQLQEGPLQFSVQLHLPQSQNPRSNRKEKADRVILLSSVSKLCRHLGWAMSKTTFFIASFSGFRADIFLISLNAKCLRFRFLDRLVAAMFTFWQCVQMRSPMYRSRLLRQNRNISNQNMQYKRLGGPVHLETHEILYFENVRLPV